MATKAIQNYCHRDFFTNTYDELYRVGQENKVFLRQYPVQQITRFCDQQAIFLTITNTASDVSSATLNVIPGALVLNWIEDSQASTTTITFTTEEEETDLATAINAVGYGWTATTEALYQTNSAYDLVVGQGGSAKQPFTLIGWLDSQSCFQGYPNSGYIQLSHKPPAQSWLSSQYWPLAMPQLNESVRCVYTAGYDPWNIPSDLQFVCAELVRLMDSGNVVVGQENMGEYQYIAAMAGDALTRLPITTQRILNSYKDRKWAGVYLG
jgi:hypothetical protein